MSARQRLLRKIWRRDQQGSQFRKVVDWLSPLDPEITHAAARQRHEPHTGTWLFQSGKYQRWRSRDIHHLWLYGKAGCGKTVLCSTVIEDIREYCEGVKIAMYATFYFTFSRQPEAVVREPPPFAGRSARMERTRLVDATPGVREA
jgi:predicted ATPase